MPRYEGQIVDALAEFAVPSIQLGTTWDGDFADQEDYEYFWSMERDGADAFVKRFGPAVAQKSHGRVRLEADNRPDRGRVKGTALYLRLIKNGSSGSGEELTFIMGPYATPFQTF